MDDLHLGVPLDQARVLCVLVHGRNQSPEAIESSVIRHLTTPGVAYLLPRAGGGSWYAAQAVDPLTDASRADLRRSLDQLEGAIVAAKAVAPGIPLLLAGFSQGSCLLLEHVFAQGPCAAGLVAFTGCRVGVAGDARPAMGLAGMPVYLTGGDADPWITVHAFAEAVAALGTSQARLRADMFPGRPHEVSPAELLVLDGALSDLAAGRAIAWAGLALPRESAP